MKADYRPAASGSPQSRDGDKSPKQRNVDGKWIYSDVTYKNVNFYVLFVLFGGSHHVKFKDDTLDLPRYRICTIFLASFLQ